MKSIFKLSSLIIFLVIINVIKTEFFIADAQNYCDLPQVNNYEISASCITTSTTAVENGNLTILGSTTTFQISPNSTLIYNPNNSINPQEGYIIFPSSSSQIKKGYLCVQDQDRDGCFTNPSYSINPMCTDPNIRYLNYTASYTPNYFGDCDDSTNKRCYLKDEICGDEIDNNCNGVIDEECGKFRTFHSAFIRNNKMYLYGGGLSVPEMIESWIEIEPGYGFTTTVPYITYKPYHKDWLVFDLNQERWISNQENLSQFKIIIYQGSSYLDNKFYILGGVTKEELDITSNPSFSRLYTFDFANNQWSTHLIPTGYVWCNYTREGPGLFPTYQVTASYRYTSPAPLYLFRNEQLLSVNIPPGYNQQGEYSETLSSFNPDNTFYSLRLGPSVSSPLVSTPQNCNQTSDVSILDYLWLSHYFKEGILAYKYNGQDMIQAGSQFRFNAQQENAIPTSTPHCQYDYCPPESSINNEETKSLFQLGNSIYSTTNSGYAIGTIKYDLPNIFGNKRTIINYDPAIARIFPFSNHGIVLHNNKLYTIQMYGNQFFGMTEGLVYDLLTNQIVDEPSFRQLPCSGNSQPAILDYWHYVPHFGASLVASNEKNKLYVYGGNFSQEKCITMLRIYDFNQRRWYFGPNPSN